MKREIFLILMLVRGCFFLQAQSTEAELLNSIQKIMDKKHIPGMFISVVSADAVLLSRGVGYSDLEEEVSVSNQLFQIGSVTKSFTAIAIMQLVERGKLSLYDTLAVLAPEVPFCNSWEDTNPILVHHLLEHKAGFDDMHFAALLKESGERMKALDEVMRHKNALTSRWHPGLVHSYSNPGYVVLGYLIEKFSGQPYQDFIRNEVMKPLHMTDTFFASQLWPSTSLKIAQGYSWYNEKINKAASFPVVGESAGSIHGNLRDMARFVQFYLNEGKSDSVVVLSMAQFEELERVHGAFEQTHRITVGYSPGLYPRHYGGDQKWMFHGHSGGILGFGSDYIYSRDLNLGIAVSNNGETGNREVMNLLVAYFAKGRGQHLKGLPISGDFKNWEGHYRMMNSRNQIFRFIDFLASTIELAVQGDSVKVTPFMSDSEYYLLNSDGGFRRSNEQASSLFLVRHDGKNVIQYQLDHYQEASSLFQNFLRILLLVSIVLGVVAILICLITLAGNGLRKVRRSTALRSLVYAMPFICLGLSQAIFISTIPLHKISQLGVFNLSTLLIWIFTLCLPISSIFSLFVLVKNCAQQENSKINYLNSAFVVGACSLSIYLASMGWLGLALWKH